MKSSIVLSRCKQELTLGHSGIWDQDEVLDVAEMPLEKTLSAKERPGRYGTQKRLSDYIGGLY